MRLIDKIQRSFDFIPQGSRGSFLLAVSGGKDSMVLLNLLYDLKYEFIVAHVNYGLRGSDSDLDEELVITEAERLKIPVYSKRVDTKKFCDENHVTVQEGARMLRYSWFEELKQAHDLAFIVTAHHTEDNKETFLQNLKRGSGLRGLKAMEIFANDRFKPMLNCTREEIDQYAEEFNIPYREDSSNKKNQYQRNLIRNKLLPLMEDTLPGIGQGIISSIANLQSDYSFLFEQLELTSSNVLVEKADHWEINNFRTLHPRLLLHVLEKFDFNFVQMDDILQSEKSGKRIVSGSSIAAVSGNDLIITKANDLVEVEIEIHEPGNTEIGEFELRISYTNKPETFSRSKTEFYLDEDKIKWPLQIRNYEEGDRITPIGMKGRKMLSDYFTDIKLPSNLRGNQLVMLSEQNIILVLGELLGDNVKVDDQTKKVLKVETLRKVRS